MPGLDKRQKLTQPLRSGAIRPNTHEEFRVLRAEVENSEDNAARTPALQILQHRLPAELMIWTQ